MQVSDFESQISDLKCRTTDFTSTGTGGGLRVALVHDWLTGMRGGEKCLEALCRLWPDATIFTLIHRPGSGSPTMEQRTIHTSFLQHVPGIFRNYRYFLPLMPAAIERFRFDRFDLVVSLSHCVAKSVRVPAGVPHVCYCFTPMRYAWHLREAYFGVEAARRRREGSRRKPEDEIRKSEDEGDRPEARSRSACHPSSSFRGPSFAAHPSPSRLSSFVPHLSAFVSRLLSPVRDLFLADLRRWDRATAGRVTQFVAISHTVQRRIRESYDRSSEVIFPPVDTRFFTPSGEPRGDFYLCVTALVPYKRLDLAVEACSRLGRRLVVIGDGPEASRLREAAGSTVTFLGWQSDESIREHYRRCRALLFPGEEDFGIVPLEAQACGAPVIAHAAGGATETVLPATLGAPGTGVFFREQTTESLIAALDRFESGCEPISHAMARENAERYCASRFARQFLSLASSVVRGEHFAAAA